MQNNCEIVDNAYMFTGLSSFGQDASFVRIIITNINFPFLLVVFFSQANTVVEKLECMYRYVEFTDSIHSMDGQ